MHVSPAGNDAWSGTAPEPNVDKTDGPLASLQGARDALRKLRAARLIEQVRNVASLLDSQSIEDQRRVLMAFCQRIVADAEAREIVVETDLTGLAQNKTLPGLPAGLSDLTLPE